MHVTVHIVNTSMYSAGKVPFSSLLCAVILTEILQNFNDTCLLHFPGGFNTSIATSYLADEPSCECIIAKSVYKIIPFMKGRLSHFSNMFQKRLFNLFNTFLEWLAHVVVRFAYKTRVIVDGRSNLCQITLPESRIKSSRQLKFTFLYQSIKC